MPGTLQHNGIAKKVDCTLMDVVRIMVNNTFYLNFCRVKSS